MIRGALVLLTILLISAATVSAVVSAEPAAPSSSSPGDNRPVDLIEAVAEVHGDTGFRLVSGIEVMVSPATLLEGITRVSELEAGELVHVIGELDGTSLTALSVSLLPGTPGPEWVSGVVTDVVGEDEVVIDRTTRIQTHPGTVLVGIASLLELAAGDAIEAEGRWIDDLFAADRVVLVQGTGDPEVFLDEVVAVLGNGAFTLPGDVVVVTSPATVLIGFVTVDDLMPGDLVEVLGHLEPGTVTVAADRVELVAPAGGNDVVEGRVAVVVPPDRFLLDTGLSVQVTPATTWIGIGGLDGLSQNDLVRVTGRTAPLGGGLLADEVVWLAGGAPVPVELEGQVTRIGADWLVLDETSTVLVGPATVFVNVADLGALSIGDRVAVTALTSGQPATYTALFVEVLEPVGIAVDLISTVTGVDPPLRFGLADGTEVLVGPGTVFLHVDGVADLVVGETVHVAGTRGTDLSNPLAVLADLVERPDGEDPPGGGGLTTVTTGVVSLLLPPASFVMDSWYTLRTTADTDWRGTLTGYDDLYVGAVVEVEILFTDGLEAAAVEDLAAAPGTEIGLSGTIVDLEGDGWLRLDGGERLLVNPLTQLDGDVDTIDEIEVDMTVAARAVPLGGDEYQALSALVEAPAGLSSFPDEPVTEALVVMTDDADAAVIAARHDAHIAGTLPGRLVYLLHWQPAVESSELEALLDEPEVESVEPNHHFHDPESDPESVRRRLIVVDRSPTSSKYRDQAAVASAGLTGAHQRTVGSGTTIAIVDTGVDPFHPLLRHRLATGGYDYVDRDNEPWETADGIDEDGDGEVDESAGHGTFVAGLALLAAPGARILPYRVLNDDGLGSTFDICLAVLDAMDRGADVINMSFVYRDSARVLDRLLMEASRRGVILIASAGNAASDSLPFPASDSRVLAVAALDDDGELTDYSNRGPGIAVGAPGEELYSSGMNGTFATWSGTSMAAPLVAGVAALVRSVHPYLTPAEVLAAISQGATPPASDGAPPRLDAAATLALVPDAP